jgi:NAD(P)-dependent dehydrogenase (short-subunit alcohol dehydrogenase family)
MKDMLKGKVAIITGATSGMGEATAKLFASEGAAVILGGRSKDKGAKIASEIEVLGGTARYYGPLDATNDESIKETIDRTIAEFGKIDILANFAGKTFDAEGLSPDEAYQKTMDFNMTSTYKMVFATLPYMKEAKSGNIIICSSNGAFNPTTPAYDYHMAKAACESLTVNLAMDVAPLGIRVNCIKPGPIVTAFWDELLDDGPERDALFDGIAKAEVPLNRLGTPDDIAGPALFFASDLSAYITGLCLYVGGGMGYVYAHGQSFLLGRTQTGK